MFIHIDQTWDLIVGKLAAWVRETILLLPNLLLAVLVMVLFWLAARGVRELMLRLVRRISRNPQVNELASQSFYVAVMAAGLFSSLGILGLDRAVTSLLAGAGIVGLALSLFASVKDSQRLAEEEPSWSQDQEMSWPRPPGRTRRD